MVDITTATTSVPLLTNWDIPPGDQIGIQPRGEVVFAGSQIIPALVAGDENRWTLQMDFPRNFHYRVVEALVSVTTDLSVDLNDAEPGMRVLVSSDSPEFQQWSFPLQSVVFPDDSAAFPSSIIIGFLSGSPIVQAFYQPPIPIDSFIDAANGAARLLLTWMNVLPVANAMTANFRFRALQYDQDQLRKFPVHTPVPTIGP